MRSISSHFCHWASEVEQPPWSFLWTYKETHFMVLNRDIKAVDLMHYSRGSAGTAWLFLSWVALASLFFPQITSSFRAAEKRFWFWTASKKISCSLKVRCEESQMGCSGAEQKSSQFDSVKVVMKYVERLIGIMVSCCDALCLFVQTFVWGIEPHSKKHTYFWIYLTDLLDSALEKHSQLLNVYTFCQNHTFSNCLHLILQQTKTR